MWALMTEKLVELQAVRARIRRPRTLSGGVVKALLTSSCCPILISSALGSSSQESSSVSNSAWKLMAASPNISTYPLSRFCALQFWSVVLRRTIVPWLFTHPSSQSAMRESVMVNVPSPRTSKPAYPELDAGRTRTMEVRTSACMPISTSMPLPGMSEMALSLHSLLPPKITAAMGQPSGTLYLGLGRPTRTRSARSVPDHCRIAYALEHMFSTPHSSKLTSTSDTPPSLMCMHP